MAMDFRETFFTCVLLVIGPVGKLLLAPSLSTPVLLFDFHPLSLSSLPGMFIDVTDAMIDSIPSPGKRKHPLLEMLTDHKMQGSHPQKSHSH